jgi:hypothetical protein
LGGSPDGITTDGILLEVKCPLKRKIVMGEVPHHYLSQVLLNLEICDLELAHFIEYIPGNSDDDYTINIVEVHRDREWFARELPKMKKFWDSVLGAREKGIETIPEYQNHKKRVVRKSSPPKGETITINKSYFIETEENESGVNQIKEKEIILKRRKKEKHCFLFFKPCVSQHCLDFLENIVF